ncbi:MAG: ATP-binding cassette domain-containing protein [Chlorobium sp.]|jgi:putative ABC transport system ATP-binding protein|uniref:ABC transporter ATP-binding protein n=1 Tax=Chlorobium sp. TaxID=1095 RepID=UPI0025BD23DA|nr:ABC transporter ATP-binding protein [Chlorobium sp.]MCF8216793.1 ATP-binding cassette domain-containing protein [Chlorobium sp.]MCF8271544.1 ATP-binding cassette domain-containing protein [Chlorobium sp.]MCF8287916.1 ATP-binding cassette domain-containing protein [Chlorobium sp.]MCF8291594.1 ATP-binding cassette domain-containing protein [Chlorobium sp.]MCF8385585.1 ATP-binding cassette domain-containing protein [Chlorobium sp.]
MMPLLEIRNLSFSWPGTSVKVFDHLDLTVHAGAFILVRGGSGTGKSTLLRLICRLNQPDNGLIIFKERNIIDIPPAVLRSMVSYVAQIPQMVDATVEENLLLPFSFATNRSKTAPGKQELVRMLAEFYLEEVGLDQSALKLSTGQKQRLAIMRAILQQPDMMLLDEPTSALDPESAAMVFSIMERLNTTRNMTILSVTHSDYSPKTLEAITCRLENKTLRINT